MSRGASFASGPAGFLAILSLLAGCVRVDRGNDAGRDDRAIPTEDACLIPGISPPGVLAPEFFLARVDEMLKEERRGAIERLVALHPDVADAALSAARRPTYALQVLAAIRDRQCSALGAADGWASILKDRGTNPGRHEAFDRSMDAWARSLREGRLAEAFRLPAPPIPEDSPCAARLKAASHRLRGVADLLAGRPGDAAREFGRGAALVRTTQPQEAARLLLLESDGEQRGGRAGTEPWTEAVKIEGRCLEASGVFDPAFWERAVEHRPPHAPWPDPSHPALAAIAERGVLGRPVEKEVAVDADVLAWASLGSQRLRRGEDRAALVAFRKAESAATGEQARGALRLGQAQALLRLGEAAAASGILGELAGRDDSAIRSGALALLGSLELKRGNAERAQALLKKAMEDPKAPEWPGRGRAEANLGIALLMAGKESEGLQRLHDAQARFESESDVEELAQALDNERRYLEQIGREKEAAQLRSRISLLDAR